MDNEQAQWSMLVGVIAAGVSQLVKSESWSRWVTLGLVIVSAGGAGYMQASGDFELRLTAATIAATTALGSWAALLSGTPIGKATKAGVWDAIAKAVSAAMKSTAKDEK